MISDAVLQLNNGTQQKDIGELLSHSHCIEKVQNGRMLKTIIESLHYLGRHGD